MILHEKINRNESIFASFSRQFKLKICQTHVYRANSYQNMFKLYFLENEIVMEKFHSFISHLFSLVFHSCSFHSWTNSSILGKFLNLIFFENENALKTLHSLLLIYFFDKRKKPFSRLCLVQRDGVRLY